MTDTRPCAKCGEEKPVDRFVKHRPRQCLDCRNKIAQGYRDRNREALRGVNRKSRFKHFYGITIADYDAMLAEQQGVCAICSTDTPGIRTKHFAVDHCHVKGTVRGLLCDKCNRGIGLLGDNLDAVLKAAKYLKRNS